MQPVLTQEQVRIIELVILGWKDSRIAADLGVSVATVQRRLRAAADQLGAQSRAGVAAHAVAAGLVHLPPGAQADDAN